MPRKQRSDAGVKRGPFKTKRRTTVDMMNGARNRPRRDGKFTRLDVCLRGHARTPDNVNPDNSCKTCKRMTDAKRRRALGMVPKTSEPPAEPDPFGWWHPKRRTA